MSRLTDAERAALQASTVRASHRMLYQWAPGLARVARVTGPAEVGGPDGPEDWAVAVRVRESHLLTPQAVASGLATRVRMAMLRDEPTERQDVQAMLDELARTHLTGGYMLEIVEYEREPAIVDIPFDEADDVRSIRYRLAPIDVGFDLRGERVPVSIEREDHVRASYADEDGERRVVSGPLELVVQRLRSVGYIVEITEAAS